MVKDQLITDNFALYNGDAAEVMQSFPSDKLHFSLYSPPFGGLYVYSSDERDLSNNYDYPGFLDHYGFFVKELERITMPGRLTGVHCTDIPSGNTGRDCLIDFPGDVIRLHQKLGWDFVSRHTIWKEPLWVRNRTLTKNLAHRTIVDDSAFGGVASADYMLMFRKRGTNQVPIAHPTGLTVYHGECPMPPDILKFKNWVGDQKKNRFSHWIWRRYASSVWDDVRMGRVLPFQDCKDINDEKHVHATQRDPMARAIILRTNPGETVLTPFAGVGTEVFEAVENGRVGVGIELKESYYRQMVANMSLVGQEVPEQAAMDFGDEEDFA